MGAALEEFLAESSRSEDGPAVCAIKALRLVLSSSDRGSTLMGIMDALRAASDELVQHVTSTRGTEYSIPVSAACRMFTHHLHSSSMLQGDSVRDMMVERGEIFAARLLGSRERVASLGYKFVGDGSKVLVHGNSKTVAAVLERAASAGAKFDVIVTEGRPECFGYKTVKRLEELGVPATLIMDSAIGYFMEKVDLVLVGAEGVFESGGVANRMGTYPIAVVAKAHKKPFYVAAEFFKFSRAFPLSQGEVGAMDVRSRADREQTKFLGVSEKEEASLQACVDMNFVDYTPPEYITLLFTDRGVLTPAAVSDELIQLYQ